MAMCIRDMMQGNPSSQKKDWWRKSLGYNAIAAGFQGQRHWTDQYPNGDTAEALLNSSFDWKGCAYRLSSLPKTTASTAWPC